MEENGIRNQSWSDGDELHSDWNQNLRISIRSNGEIRVTDCEDIVKWRVRPGDSDHVIDFKYGDILK